MATSAVDTTLYNGKHHIIFNPLARGRAPRYKVDDVAYQGVTTILGNTLAKKGLMTWPMDVALAYVKSKLPIVTEEDITIAAAEHERLRDAGGNTGTEAHSMVEEYLYGGEPTDQHSQEAINAYTAFVKWFEATKPEIIGIENLIYSEELAFAGTYDCLLEINNKVTLCDLKTTNPSREAPNGVYAENFFQLGGYALAYEEQRIFEIANGGSELEEIEELTIISCKKNGKCDIVSASDLGLTVQDCMELFAYVAKINKALIELKGKLK